MDDDPTNCAETSETWFHSLIKYDVYVLSLTRGAALKDQPFQLIVDSRVHVETSLSS